MKPVTKREVNLRSFLIKKIRLSILLLSICSIIFIAFSGVETKSSGNSDNETFSTSQSMPNLTGDEAKDYLKKQGLYESLNETMAASRYSIYPTKNAPLPKYKEAFEANNPKQSFSTYFAKDGLHLVSKAKDKKWHIQMELKGYAYGDKFEEVEERNAEVQKDKSRIEIRKSAGQNGESEITEWYENQADGLEQGWTINEKLSESNEELSLVLALKGDLNAKLAKDKQAIHFVNSKDEQILRYSKLKSWDANGKELASRMELKDQELSIVVDEREAEYPITIDPFFTHTKKITASDAADLDRFGFAVAISGHTAIVGAYLADSSGTDSGSAYIYERNIGGADNWGEVKKLDASGIVSNDHFGWSVGISDHTAIVGARLDHSGVRTGSAFIFDRNTGGTDNWGEVKRLIPSDGEDTDVFGISVGVSVNTVIVGANFDDDHGSKSGSAYIFERNTGGADNWGEVKKLTASDATTEDNFGVSVGISDHTAIVGADSNDDHGSKSGSAYIFERNTGGADNWGEVKKLLASDAATEDYFGISVGISGHTAIVGAFGNDDGGFRSGSAYIFERNIGGTNNWGELKKLVASDAGAEDQFGWSVGISGDAVIVGARSDNDRGFASGSAYIFERNTDGANNWGQIQELTAPDTSSLDFYGISVGISSDTAIVGAHANNDDHSNETGSAYIYNNIFNNWTEMSGSLSSDGEAGDSYGISIAISGDTAIVGAYLDDDDGVDSGSAYILERNAGGANNWGEVKKLTSSDAFTGDYFGYSVGVSGDTVIVGAYKNDGVGSAYIYERNTGGADNWGEVKKLLASDAASIDGLGGAVGISDDRAIVGAYNNDGGGSAYIYERNTGGADNWGEVKKLLASDAASEDSFGISVEISGDTAIVGASGNDDAGSFSGSAYIFERNTGGADNWGEVKKLVASDASSSDRFGISVGILGDRAIVGAFLAGSVGAVYIYERNTGGANNWGEVKKLTASIAGAGDGFGASVGMSGDRIIVGAQSSDGDGFASGSAYIFKRNTGGVNNWGEVKKLTASDAAAGDVFGASVAISGDIVLVGAYLKDVLAPPFRGKQTNKTFLNATEKNTKKLANLAGADQGKVYVFEALSAPTAANTSLSGRVTTSKGVPIPRTLIYLTDKNGNSMTVRANQFGYFIFEDIEVGQILILNAYSKRYQFGAQVLNFNDSITSLNIVPQ